MPKNKVLAFVITFILILCVIVHFHVRFKIYTTTEIVNFHYDIEFTLDPLASAILKNKPLDEIQAILDDKELNYTAKKLDTPIPLGNYPDSWYRNYSATHLTLAAKKNRTALVQLLLSRGANPKLDSQYQPQSEVDIKKIIPLCIALDNENEDMIRVLVVHGASFDEPNREIFKNAITPLDASSEFIDALLNMDNVPEDFKDRLCQVKEKQQILTDDDVPDVFKRYGRYNTLEKWCASRQRQIQHLNSQIPENDGVLLE
ncbi:MAG: ankyrin repeat domain-containing protein [Planctomycetaceae bacterium]|nr:ankyrin repeat domain-containing protein [Planctomycetaceae bacterium]